MLLSKIPSPPRLPVLLALLSVAGTLPVGRAVPIGPVPLSSVPGMSCTDSDTGTGTAHGRVGGRTFDCTIADPADFVSMEWDLVGAGMALDGRFDDGVPAEGETIFPSDPSFACASVDPQTTECTGGTRIFYAGGTFELLPTKLVLTTSPNIVFGGAAGTSATTIDLLAETSFQVNFLFHVFSGGSWQPALDFFDASPTDPNQNGDALTSFTQGVTFELSDSGGTCDAVLEQVINGFSAASTAHSSIQGVLEYLNIEWNGRIPNLQTDIGDIKNHVQPGGTVMALLQQVYDTVSAGSGGAGSDAMLPVQMLACVIFGPENVEVQPGVTINLCDIQSQNLPPALNGLEKQTLPGLADKIQVLQDLVEPLQLRIFCAIVGPAPSPDVAAFDLCGDLDNFWPSFGFPFELPSLTSITEDVLALGGSIQALSTTTGNVAGDVAAILSQSTSLLTTDIPALGIGISSVSTDIGNLSNEVGSIATDVTILQTDLANIGLNTADIGADVDNIATGARGSPTRPGTLWTNG